MTLPTDEEVRTALMANWRDHGDGMWSCSSVIYQYAEETALALTRACLILGVPVTETLEGKTWAVLVERVVRMELRLDRMDEERAEDLRRREWSARE